MNGLIFVILAAALLATVSGTPELGYGHGYGHGHGGYKSAYGFVASGYGHGHGHGHGGTAKVHAESNPHSFNYALNEHGPHSTRYIHNSGHIHYGHAAPVKIVGYGHGHGHGHGHGGAYGHGRAY